MASRRQMPKTQLSGAEAAITIIGPAETAYDFHRAKRGSDKSVVKVTFAPCNHEQTFHHSGVSDGEFLFKIPVSCPKCHDLYFFFRSDGDKLKPLATPPRL